MPTPPPAPPPRAPHVSRLHVSASRRASDVRKCPVSAPSHHILPRDQSGPNGTYLGPIRDLVFHQTLAPPPTQTPVGSPLATPAPNHKLFVLSPPSKPPPPI